MYIERCLFCPFTSEFFFTKVNFSFGFFAANLLKKFIFNFRVAVLNLDYLKVAQSALFCSAHFTAILYAELWCQTEIKRLSITQRDLSLTSLDYICQNQEPEIAEAVQFIFREVKK